MLNIEFKPFKDRCFTRILKILQRYNITAAYEKSVGIGEVGGYGKGNFQFFKL